MPPRHVSQLRPCLAFRIVGVSMILLAFPGGEGIGKGPAPAGPPNLPDDPASIVAVVGESPILLGELRPKADARIKQVLQQTGKKIPPEQLETVRANLIRGLLAQAIQSKMMRESFLLDQVGGQAADKHAEAREMMRSPRKTDVW